MPSSKIGLNPNLSKNLDLFLTYLKLIFEFKKFTIRLKIQLRLRILWGTTGFVLEAVVHATGSLEKGRVVYMSRKREVTRNTVVLTVSGSKLLLMEQDH